VIALLVAGVVFNVPAGPLGNALRAWGSQAHVELLFKESDLRGLYTLGYKCDCDPLEALDAIIDGQEVVSWDIHKDGMVSVRRVPPEEISL
jgi:hypothetical protein